MKPLFDVSLERLPTPAVVRVLGYALQTLVAANIEWMRRHPTPHPYQVQGLRYQREKDEERWKGAFRVIEDGHGDCEDLASYLAAWYLVNHAQGHKTRIVIQSADRPRGRLFHILVRNPQGQLEDPSRRLGMGEV